MEPAGLVIAMKACPGLRSGIDSQLVTPAVEGLPRTPIRGENPRTNIPQGNVNSDATYYTRAETPCSAIYHVEGRLSRPAALAYSSIISTTLTGSGMPFSSLSRDSSHSISPGT